MKFVSDKLDLKLGDVVTTTSCSTDTPGFNYGIEDIGNGKAVVTSTPKIPTAAIEAAKVVNRVRYATAVL